MSLRLLRLDFGANRVHFGGFDDRIGLDGAMPQLLADTFFSAICHGWIQLFGQEALETLLQQFQSSTPPWRHTDGFPYYRKAIPLFPKPVASPGPDNIPTKKFRQVRFLTAKQTFTFLQEGLRHENEDYPQEKDIWIAETACHVNVNRHITDSDPFSVSYLQFTKDAGLWVLFDFADERILPQLKQVVQYLGEDVGIGGERSTGAGRFTPEWSDECPGSEAGQLLQEIQSSGFVWGPDANRYLLLSLSNPMPEETGLVQSKESRYTLIHRRGFHYSLNNGWPGAVKKRPVGMLMSGSLFARPLQGRLVDVTPELDEGRQAPHRLYRYGIAFCMGIQAS